MNKKDKERLIEDIIALFLFVMKYNRELNPILSKYKSYKSEILLEIDKIYKKYTKDDKLQMTSSEINQELKKINDKILKLSRDLYKQEKKILPVILLFVIDKTYKQTYNIMFKDLIKDLSDMKKGVKDDIIYKKIKGKDNLMRVKENKTIFYNKITKDIKDSLKDSNSIEKTKRIIEDRFISEEKRSQRFINNEISRVFNDINIMILEKEGVNRVEWVAQLEKNTCSQCASLDSQVFNIEDAPVPIYSTHTNCHCILVSAD